ncbi:DUF429 domain-containing protein [Haloarchaeobius sp. HRN-SO-5]|uniref:DUF429 domain-containing protein n=1 Tax=Haloarchaeobius sp. HRN-SO-5 TaxID=3446118 RepID=UPI003EBFD03A
METNAPFVGVDGCPDGWVAVRYGSDSFVDARRYGSIEALWEDNRDAETILVDVPVGVADDAAAREPEREARAVLGPRSSSVFNVPIRPVLGVEDYHDANEEQKDRIDTGLQRQTHAIAPRIRAVDDLLRDDDVGATQDVLREAHPEVCFWAFAGETPMAYSKTGQPAAAFWERVEVLEPVDEEFVTHLRAAGNAVRDWADPELSNDDLLDAFVLALTAREGAGDYRTLPAEPATDAAGLRMEMVFAHPG